MSKKIFKEMPMATAAALGIIFSCIMSISLLLLLTAMINGGHAALNLGNYVTPVVQGVSTLFGSMFAGKLAGEKKSIACLLTAGGYLLFLFLIALLFMDGINENAFWGTAATLCGCIGGVLLCTMKSTHKKKKAKSHFR